ncbi:hypothetical protein ACWEVD_16330 [Nocardia thailandica]
MLVATLVVGVLALLRRLRARDAPGAARRRRPTWVAPVVAAGLLVVAAGVGAWVLAPCLFCPEVANAVFRGI